jgi:hypothetical protein
MMEVTKQVDYFNSHQNDDDSDSSMSCDWGKGPGEQAWKSPKNDEGPQQSKLKKAVCESCNMSGHNKYMCLHSVPETLDSHPLIICCQCGEIGHVVCKPPQVKDKKYDASEFWKALDPKHRKAMFETGAPDIF